MDRYSTGLLGDGCMKACNNGEWVRLEDVEQLKADNERLYEKGREDGRAEMQEAASAACQCNELKAENERLKESVKKHLADAYCQMCGSTLDGYNPENHK